MKSKIKKIGSLFLRISFLVALIIGFGASIIIYKLIKNVPDDLEEKVRDALHLKLNKEQ